MSDTVKGLWAMIGATLLWGSSSLVYKALSHVPAAEVLSHRMVWSIIFFGIVLTAQRRPLAPFTALKTRRDLAIMALSSLMIAVNWFLFIWAVQNGHATEGALGYYIYPLFAVLIGWLFFGERLVWLQWLAVGMVALAVAVLTWGLGVAPWIALALAVSFTMYGVIKKQLNIGPVVSVTLEVLFLLPVAVVILWQTHHNGLGHFGGQISDTALLMLCGPVTALPLILFSYAARRLPMTTVGLLSYINPTFQFLLAVFIYAEPFTGWHVQAFVLIWAALAIYSMTTLRQDKARRKAIRAASASGAGAI